MALASEQHKQRHVELHKALDEIVADFIDHTGKLPSQTPVMEVMRWSHRQAISPDEKGARHV